ncbi:MAG: AI-2E family transporter [Erysipelotrichaceae bacterium]
MKNKDWWITIKPWMILSTYIIVLSIALLNFVPVMGWVSSIISLFTSLFYGIVIAYILNIPMSRIERKLKKWLKEDSFLSRKARSISIILTILLAIIFFFVVGSIILPKLGQSMIQLVDNMSKFFTNIIANLNDVLKYFHIDYTLKANDTLLEIANLPWENILKQAANALTSGASGVMSSTVGFIMEFFLWFTGFMFSFYLISNKESFIIQLRKVMVVALKEKKAQYLFDCGSKANRIFSSFISGQLLEACILGVLYYISMRILNFPFPELISALIAICSIVPVFGSMFAMSIGAIMILSINPITAIWFVVFYQLMQQFEDNVIYPRVVGNSVGLPGLWVLLSIFVFGDLFGILGMVMAVPTTAFIYTMFADFINQILKKRKLKVDLNRIEHLDK